MFKIGSMEPGAMLFDASKEFEASNAGKMVSRLPEPGWDPPPPHTHTHTLTHTLLSQGSRSPGPPLSEDLDPPLRATLGEPVVGWPVVG